MLFKKFKKYIKIYTTLDKVDKNDTCLISTSDLQIEKIIKSLGIEMPNLTTIDKIDKFKNQLNKDIFM